MTSEYDYYMKKLQDWREGKALYEEVEDAREIYELSKNEVKKWARDTG